MFSQLACALDQSGSESLTDQKQEYGMLAASGFRSSLSSDTVEQLYGSKDAECSKKIVSEVTFRRF